MVLTTCPVSHLVLINSPCQPDPSPSLWCPQKGKHNNMIISKVIRDKKDGEDSILFLGHYYNWILGCYCQCSQVTSFWLSSVGCFGETKIHVSVYGKKMFIKGYIWNLKQDFEKQHVNYPFYWHYFLLSPLLSVRAICSTLYTHGADNDNSTHYCECNPSMNKVS